MLIFCIFISGFDCFFDLITQAAAALAAASSSFDGYTLQRMDSVFINNDRASVFSTYKSFSFATRAGTPTAVRKNKRHRQRQLLSRILFFR
jgi:hypothetical protein